MEASSHFTPGRGLWNNPRATQSSKESQDMLRLMKQESRLTNFQRKQINKSSKNEPALPLTWNTAPSSQTKFVQKHISGHSQRRSAECCRSGNSYTREMFRPGPTRDLEKEKRRLQNILATGQEEIRVASREKVPAKCTTEKSEEEQRYEEVLNGIEERRQFLADMASLGQEREYIGIIDTEISQKIRELELLEKTSRPK
ncbi:UPF0193 protein EVG1 [Mugil cephalus]|uniref:UPF0193 protein EVG1 n=1 Tax=Mugil cephalus TaxID=48193 RepID=UPI001FB84DE5|nr:UPF0193 protein EVG1 [Mugil cephalus]XP_047433304.1 UPF0193 protein EVG1 [Mugil cephalus]